MAHRRALARLLDREGDHAGAFEQARVGNALTASRRALDDEHADQRALLASRQRLYTAETLAAALQAAKTE